MNELIPVQFDRPGWLLMLLLIIPVFFLARRSIGGLSRAKSTITFTLRVLVILLLSVALSHPIWEKRGEGLTVTVILDRSQSIPLSLQSNSLDFLRKMEVEMPAGINLRQAIINRSVIELSVMKAYRDHPPEKV